MTSDRSNEDHNGARQEPCIPSADEVLRSVASQDAELSRLSPTAMPAVEAMCSLDLSVLVRAAEEVRAESKRVAELIVRIQGQSLEQLAAPLRDQQRLLESAVRGLDVWRYSEEMTEAQRRLHRSFTLTSAALRSFQLPSEAMKANLAAVSEVVTRYLAAEAARARFFALRPVWELVGFSQSVLERVAEEEDGCPAADAAGRVIEAATIETTASTDLIVSLLETVKSVWFPSEPVPPTWPTFNLFSVQSSEVDGLVQARYAPRQIDITALPSSVAARLARALGQLIVEINSISELSAKEAVFKPTTRLFERGGSLPFLIAVDRATFDEFSTSLYQLLYEGSGCAQRILAYLDKGSCGALWAVVDLRKWAQHDIDHGDQPKVRKTRSLVRTHFQGLIGKVLPQTPGDFRTAQMRLLDRLVRMLRQLKAKLVSEDAQARQ